MRNICKRNIANSGFVFIEVLLTTFILAFALLAIASFYLNSLQRSHHAYLRTLAATQLRSIFEQYLAGDQDCSVWQKECARLLPHGVGKCNAKSFSVCWQERSNPKQCLEIR